MVTMVSGNIYLNVFSLPMQTVCVVSEAPSLPPFGRASFLVRPFILSPIACLGFEESFD
jgi:hypothetical protein